jgi:hypothetical protein
MLMQSVVGGGDAQADEDHGQVEAPCPAEPFPSIDLDDLAWHPRSPPLDGDAL